MVMASSTPRKGTTRAADIPDEVLQALSRGEIQSATLAESTALDPSRLAQTVFPELSPQALKAVDAACELGVLKCMARLPTCRMRSPTGSRTLPRISPPGYGVSAASGWKAHRPMLPGAFASVPYATSSKGNERVHSRSREMDGRCIQVSATCTLRMVV